MKLQLEPDAAVLLNARPADMTDIESQKVLATPSAEPRRGSVLERLKFYLFRRRTLAREGVIMDLTAYCDRDSAFEGHNRVMAGAKLIKSRLGVGSYVGPRSLLMNTSVGRYSCIGPGVETIIGAHPTSGFVSVHPAFFSTQKQAGFTFATKDLFPEFGVGRTENDCLVEIGSDVWIGYGARLMQGIKIGHGAIVAAGSIVTKDVAPYTIVAGIPARPLRLRFSDDHVRRLLATQWWLLDFAQISRLAIHFASPDGLLRELERPKP